MALPIYLSVLCISTSNLSNPRVPMALPVYLSVSVLCNSTSNLSNPRVPMALPVYLSVLCDSTSNLIPRMPMALPVYCLCL